MRWNLCGLCSSSSTNTNTHTTPNTVRPAVALLYPDIVNNGPPTMNMNNQNETYAGSLPQNTATTTNVDDDKGNKSDNDDTNEESGVDLTAGAKSSSSFNLLARAKTMETNLLEGINAINDDVDDNSDMMMSVSDDSDDDIRNESSEEATTSSSSFRGVNFVDL